MAQPVNDRSRPGPFRKCARNVGAIAVTLGASSYCPSAGAEPASALPIELGWDAPASCPPSDDIERDVRRLLGDAPLPDEVPPIVANVSVHQSPDGSFDVRVRTTSGGQERERELRVETCDEARRLVAFLLAFLVDPRVSEGPHEESPLPKSAASASTAPPPPKPPKPPPQPAPERSPRWAASVLVSADLGMLPSASLGGELRGGLLFPNWSLEARATAWLPRRAESPDVAGAGGEFTMFDAGLLGCLRSSGREAPTLQVCAGPVLLWLQGEAYGVAEPGQDEALFFGASGEAALLVALSSRTSLRMGLGALVPFSRPTFAIHDVGPIHRPSAAAARGSLGFEVNF